MIIKLEISKTIIIMIKILLFCLEFVYNCHEGVITMYKYLEPYAAMIEFLGKALGDNVEIALHDLTSKEQEIVAIANNHNSGREVGAKLSNLSLHYLEEKQYLDNDYVMNYKTTGPDGKLMRSATYFIKEPGKEMPVGMLCINVNISDLEYLTSTIKKS